DYVFFWKPDTPHGWASQWYHSPFTARIDVAVPARGIEIRAEEAHTFETAEHWMMACKALLFGDDDAFRAVLAADAGDMRRVKALGRAVRGFDDDTWNAAREEVVFRGNVHKFRQNAELGETLLATGDKVLVEASPRDRIWGIGFGEKRALEVKERWGLNLLGKALTQVR
ncbi:uncharacterized protein PHACADRAFT_48531, partial [Phanerochaete carnosa HHB-10118-sp]